MKHYLKVKKYIIYDDSTGTEQVELRRKIREDIEFMLKELAPHQITPKVHSESFWDHRTLGQVHAVALEFENKNDLALSVLLLQSVINYN